MIMKSASREDYLRAIFSLGENRGGTVKSIDIVKHLNVSKPAVSEMLKKLQAEEYIEKTPYSSITLTAQGLEIAKNINHKYSIAERFLRDVLEVDDDKLPGEAHKLEHSMSDGVADKLRAFLEKSKPI